MYKGAKSYADADLYSLSKLPGGSLFAKASASFHIVGKGDKIGPDLKGVTERREANWLCHMKNPVAMRAAKAETKSMEHCGSHKGSEETPGKDS